MNIEFSYLYRDSENYKLFNSIVFKDSSEVDIIEVKKSLENECYFNPKEIDLPILSFKEWDEDTDHTNHEFFDLVETENPPTDA